VRFTILKWNESTEQYDEQVFNESKSVYSTIKREISGDRNSIKRRPL